MNPLRHFLVHIDSSPASLTRLKMAEALAGQFDAQVTALYAVTPWLLLYPVALEAGSLVSNELSDLDRSRLLKTRAAITAATVGMDRVHWEELDSESPYQLAHRALYADLMVLGQRCEAGAARDDVPADFVSSMIIHSGRPALVVPHAGQPVVPASTVLVAWNASREAARALSAALPFLQQARQVHVAVWTSPEHDQLDNVADIQRYLKQHGMEPVIHARQSTSRDVGNQLLSMATDVGAGLLVMGCYGHHRAREWIMGGTTKTVLGTMTLPVLMAH